MASHIQYVMIVNLLIAAACAGLGGASEPAGVAGGPPEPTVKVGSASFEVEIADTPSARSMGLSGRESLPAASGMLFVFESGVASSFWMKGMLIPLDFVWIGEDCSVIETMVDVPHPADPSDNPPIFRSSAPSKYVLEINAGEVAGLGVDVGDAVTFHGFDGDC